MRRISVIIIFLAMISMGYCQDNTGQPEINLSKPKITLNLNISRVIKNDIDKRMINIAENTYPPRNKVIEAIQNWRSPGHMKEIPSGEKLWWYDENEGDGIRIPYSITAEAVVYYTNLIEKYRNGGGGNSHFSVLESNFTYSASVELKENYEKDSESFKDVYVVDLKLDFRMVCGSLCATIFLKEKTVILDKEGKVLKVFGDGQTMVEVS